MCKYYIFHLIFIFSLIYSTANTLHCAPLSYSGTAIYSNNQEGQSQESIHQNLTFGMSQELTTLLVLNENLRYSNIWSDGSNTREYYSPQIRLSNNNDLFSWDISASINQSNQSSGPGSTMQTVESFWSSQWKKPYIPSLTLNFGQDVNEDNVHPHMLNTKTLRTGLGSDWDIWIGNLSCNYSYTDKINKIIQTEDIADNLSILFSGSRSYFANKIHFSYSQKYNEQHQQREMSNVDKVGNEGYYPFIPMQALYQNDSTPENGILIEQGSLIDGKTTDSSVIFTPGQTINLGVKVNALRVDRISVYTLQDLTASKDLFKWDLYSSADGSIWTLENSLLSSTYTSMHFEITVPGAQKTYLKIVALNPPLAIPIDITEIQVFRFDSSSVSSLSYETSYKNYLTSLGVGINFTQNLSMMYNISYETGKPSNGQYFNQRMQSANLNWLPVKNLTTRLNAGEMLQEYEANPTMLSRSYGVALTYPPLPTLDINIGAERSETFIGGNKNITGQGYNFSANAALYRDLDSGFEFRYNKVTNENTQLTNDNWSSMLGLTARLNPKLTSVFSVNYNYSSGDTSDNQSISMNIDVNWRISDIMYIQSNIGQQWDLNGDGINRLRLSYDLAPTSTTQLSLTYYAENTQNLTQTSSASIRWMIINNLSMSLNCSYFDNETIYNYYVNIALGLSF